MYLYVDVECGYDPHAGYLPKSKKIDCIRLGVFNWVHGTTAARAQLFRIGAEEKWSVEM